MNQLSSPAALRNRDPIAGIVADVLPRSGLVLEIASGTGEHVAHFARRFAHLNFQPSDPDADARASIAAYAAGEALPKDYVVLKAGEKLSTPLALQQCFDLSKEGVYTVTARYADGNPKVPPAPAGETHLSEALTSNQVQIRIHR